MCRTIGDIIAHKKRLKEMLLSFNDNEKLNYIFQLLNKNIEMFTSCSDTHGIEFTNDWEQQQNDIEVFLEVLKEEKR